MEGCCSLHRKREAHFTDCFPTAPALSRSGSVLSPTKKSHVRRAYSGMETLDLPGGARALGDAHALKLRDFEAVIGAYTSFLTGLRDTRYCVPTSGEQL